MTIKKLGLVLVPALLLATVLPVSAEASRARHVRWDIIHLAGGAPPGPVTAGGIASAKAPDGDKITLTGSGTFISARGDDDGPRVTGGGTWQTATGSGSYKVTGLVSFVFANFQSATPPLTDNIGNTDQRANGTAVLKVRFSDGQSGVLTVGCHGPGAPPGIFEGIATTKGYKTYYAVEDPVGGVDADRTIFHVR